MSNEVTKVELETIATSKRCLEALQWRLKGMSHDEIGSAMGITPTKVGTYIKQAMQDIEDQRRELSLALMRRDLDDIERMREYYLPQSMGMPPPGKPEREVDIVKAGQMVVALREQRAKLLGTDTDDKKPINEGMAVWTPREKSASEWLTDTRQTSTTPLPPA